MKFISNAILLSVFLLIVSACNKSDSEEERYIEEALMAHFEQFVTEASEYNIDVDLNQLDIAGYIQNIESTGTVGQCKIYSDGSQEVIVDQSYWNRISDAQKEWLIFHELGHCILGRDHDDDRITGNRCKSIMTSGSSGCSIIYTEANRPYYVQELFEN